ncbi:NUT family member 2G-like [Myotis yumanensis]|uniref:NUT family member 2G-like n=1 Tax=Myotis yumanensis TaxID=159337 RepID=UPI0038D17CBB
MGSKLSSGINPNWRSEPDNDLRTAATSAVCPSEWPSPGRLTALTPQWLQGAQSASVLFAGSPPLFTLSFVSTASAALGVDVTLKAGPSMTPFTAQPFPPPTTGPAHQPPWEQHLPPLRTPSFPPGHPLVLPALPRTPLVAGDADQGPAGPGACNIMDQVRSEGGRPQPSQTQTIVLTQAPLNMSAPGAICGSAVCPAPLFLEATVVETIMPASTFGGTQAGDGGWCPGLPPQAPPLAAQLASIIPRVDPGPRPHTVSKEGGLAASKSKASLDDACNPKSVYEDFRRWQCFKALARGHLPQSPDAGALCCFLMSVLQSLSHLRPTMTLEEGIGQAMQEWQNKSNFDRRVYSEMAEKFMEIEVEEQMQFQKLQLKKGLQTQPPPAPWRPNPRGPPAPVVGGQPARTTRKAVPSAQCAHTAPLPRETESRNGIPPEAEQEDMDIMDELPMGAPGGGWEDEEMEWLQDEGLLSYLDQLCSQEDFVTQVEEVIDSQFLKQMNSPDAQQDPLALAEELEQEEGLTAAQLVEKRVLASKEGDVQAPPSHGAPLWDSSPSESATRQDAQRRDRVPQLEVSDKACPPETDFKDQQRRGPAGAHRPRPQAFAVSVGRQEHPPLRARCLASAPQGHGPADCALGPREACVPREASPVRETHGPVDRPREEDEDLRSLAFLWASPGRLLPCALSLSPVPASGMACPGGRGPRGAALSQSLQRRGLSRAAPAASKSQKLALGGGPVHAEKTPRPGADLGVCGRPALALGLVPSSQPRKRKCDPSDPGSGRKRHCSQDGAEGCAPHCQHPEGPRLHGAWLSPRGAKGSFSSQG